MYQTMTFIREPAKFPYLPHALIGIAVTLMALPPVIILPVSYFVYREQIGWQALIGTVLAIAGVAVLFLA